MKELQKEFEKSGYTSWINSDIYPDGKIYTKEYTEWLESKIYTYADEQSVAFNNWINKNYYLFVNNGYITKGRFNKFQEDTKVYTTTELLTIFKNENNGK